MSSATIEARGATKRFGKTSALDGFNLVAEPGEVVALLGPNGAGKTTFVRAVATLLRLDGGELLVAGHDASREPAAVRQVIGLAGQFAAVEPAMTGRENLEMVARLFGKRRRDAKQAAAAVLGQMGLDEAADQQVKSYSGGMRRRLDLGASLVGEPRLLLLDEPTTGLDPRSRTELWDAIRALVGLGTDVLLTTQYMDEADQLASQIVIIDHGKAVAAGTPADLKRRVGGRVIEVRTRFREDLPIVAAALGRLDHGTARVDEATRKVSLGVDDPGLLSVALQAMETSRGPYRRHLAAPTEPRRSVPGPHQRSIERKEMTTVTVRDVGPGLPTCREHDPHRHQHRAGGQAGPDPFFPYPTVDRDGNSADGAVPLHLSLRPRWRGQPASDARDHLRRFPCPRLRFYRRTVLGDRCRHGRC